MVAGVLLAWAVILVPSLIQVPGWQLAVFTLVQLVICGIILGAGRQGIDVLLLRLFSTAMALLIYLFVANLMDHRPLCLGVQDCSQLLVLETLLFGILGTAAMLVVALPVSVIWNRGFSNLGPESRWFPNRWWQWLLVVLGLLVGIPVLLILVGVPFPG